MFKRDASLYLNDIQESITAIEAFTRDIDYEFFHNDRKTYSATLREFIVIGEAIVHIPEAVKAQFPAIQWRLIKDFRNFIRARILRRRSAYRLGCSSAGVAAVEG